MLSHSNPDDDCDHETADRKRVANGLHCVTVAAGGDVRRAAANPPAPRGRKERDFLPMRFWRVGEITWECAAQRAGRATMKSPQFILKRIETTNLLAPSFASPGTKLGTDTPNRSLKVDALATWS